VTLDYRFGPALPPGVHRLAFQCDVGAGKAMAWVDGASVAAGATPRVPPGLVFAENERVPMKVGAAGLLASTGGSDWYTPPPERADVLGLSLADDLRYAWEDRPRRLDGGPAADDQYRYFTDWPPVVAMLPLEDDPQQVTKDRCLRVRNGGPNYSDGTALLLSPAHGNPWAAVGGNAARGAAIKAGGDAILVGGALYPAIEDCDLTGTTGIGTWGWGANYTGAVRRTAAVGYDAAFHFYLGMWSMEDCHVEAVPRHGIWARASRVRARGTMYGPYGNTVTYATADRGADLELADTLIDREDDGGPSRAVFVVESDSAGAEAQGARLVVRDLKFGTFAPNVPLILARTRKGAPQGLIRLTDPTTSGAGLAGRRPLVRVDDPNGWDVRVDAPALKGWPQVVGGDGKGVQP
jgi:hypothetical protein